MSLTVTRKAQTCYTQDVRNPQPGTLSLMSAAATACRALAASLILLVGARSACHAQPCSDPPQIPLCMIGDSITWAGEGDHWRRLLLERLPRLAFVGTHSACLGYSHAGEGGNSTGRVITRLADLPDCPYYSLEIGTNDNSITDPAQMENQAAQTAQRIIDIVNGLLAKPCTRKVFLGSVLPCHTDNPLRDQTNSATNKILRERFDQAFPDGRVVWVEYEQPIRAIKGWEPLILLHPTIEGYKIIAGILADSIIKALAIEDPARKPEFARGCGVRVENLWDQTSQTTRIPVIAGWYTLSCDIARVDGTNARVLVTSPTDDTGKRLSLEFAVKAEDAGKRLTFPVFTGYEGYQYTRAPISVRGDECALERIQFEKRRPSGVASTWFETSGVDVNHAPSLGELVVRP